MPRAWDRLEAADELAGAVDQISHPEERHLSARSLLLDDGAILAARDVHTGGGVAFARLRVRDVRRAYNLQPRYERLRARGYLTRHEMAKMLHVVPETVKIWRSRGLLRAEAGDDRGNYLYPPDQPPPRRLKVSGLPKPHRRRSLAANRPNSSKRVFFGCNSRPNFISRSRISARNLSASDWC